MALGAALLLAALAAGLWFGPRLLDWDHFRVELAEIAAARLGRPVVLEGPVQLSLLPEPMIQAERVRIGTPGDDVSVQADTMELQLGLLSLLGGRLEPRALSLVGGEMRLPWPPDTGLAVRPPVWLTALDARIEHARVILGTLPLDDFSARLSTAGPNEALHADGEFHWRAQLVRFSATLGRAGGDDVAPLDVSVSGGEGRAAARATARGALLPEGGFEGTVEASGSDLSALLPAPAGPFRLGGRLTAGAELLAADDLAFDLNGTAAHGAVTLRVAPAPRLDVALRAGRLDLDSWGAALRGEAAPPVPTGIDLSAEAASFHGVTLRRVRGTVFLDGERRSIPNAAALLPGDAEVELSGAAQGATQGANRLELNLRFAAPALRDTLAAIGLPLPGGDPTRLRAANGRMQLVLEEQQLSVPELQATLDGARVSGAGVWRYGARPGIGIGLTLDRLDLDSWITGQPEWRSVSNWLGNFDGNLRLAADSLSWRGIALERASVDTSLERGRLTVRRVAGRLAGTDVAASGTLQLGETPRLSDLSLELGGSSAGGIAGLLPRPWRGRLDQLAGPLALRLTGGGAADALALRLELDCGELRLDANGTLDLPARRGIGQLTLRHPGASRLLSALLLPDASWLGEGSLALIANLAGGPQGVSAESFDLVAGGLRAWGQLGLALGGARPRLTGRISAERLPLPPWRWRDESPLGLDRLGALDAELALDAAAVEIGDAARVRNATAALRLDAGVLRLDDVRGQLGTGTVAGGLLLDGAAARPRLALTGRIDGATVTGPVLGLPLDLPAGRAELSVQATAEGYSAAGLLATAAGELRLGVADGVVTGFDLGAVPAAAALPDPQGAAVALRQALSAGATRFKRLDLPARLDAGRVVLGDAQLVALRPDEVPEMPTGIAGQVDLARATLDLRLTVPTVAPVVGAPPVAASGPPTDTSSGTPPGTATGAPDGASTDGGSGTPPPLRVRITGPSFSPQRIPEIADWARWRAEHG